MDLRFREGREYRENVAPYQIMKKNYLLKDIKIQTQRY
jgi:hypothetical protein